jgi:hypothetical protein
MHVKVVLKDRKEMRTASIAEFDNVSEANRYIKALLIESLIEPSLRKYEIIISHEEEKGEG